MGITPSDDISPLGYVGPNQTVNSGVNYIIVAHCTHCPVQLTLIFEVSRQQMLSPVGCCPSLELLKSTVFVGPS